MLRRVNTASWSAFRLSPSKREPPPVLGQNSFESERHHGHVSFKLCAHRVRKVGWEALESSYAVLQTAAIPSQLPAQILLGRFFDRQESTKKARCRYDTGPLCSSKSRPSVISAYFRWRAHSRAVHSPVGQMRTSTATPSAISVLSLILNASFRSPLPLLYPIKGSMFRCSIYKSVSSVIGSYKIQKKFPIRCS